jgi:hypothetical protein
MLRQWGNVTALILLLYEKINADKTGELNEQNNFQVLDVFKN